MLSAIFIHFVLVLWWFSSPCNSHLHPAEATEEAVVCRELTPEQSWISSGFYGYRCCLLILWYSSLELHLRALTTSSLTFNLVFKKFKPGFRTCHSSNPALIKVHIGMTSTAVSWSCWISQLHLMQCSYLSFGSLCWHLRHWTGMVQFLAGADEQLKT